MVHRSTADRRGVLAASLCAALAGGSGATAAAGTIESAPYGRTVSGQDVTITTLRNDNGVTVKFLDYGGIVTEIDVPDREGHLDNVVLGCKTLHDYETVNPYFGTIVGRYANRIAKGRFTLDGQEYHLPINNGPNSLHGGPRGFDKQIWGVKTQKGP
ncbi:MAG: galactose-1-epimerase, partial [Acetobacteraceae bacterium]|nr:galactose-1-epimerase [Acetobacteraceae bacterium]